MSSKKPSHHHLSVCVQGGKRAKMMAAPSRPSVRHLVRASTAVTPRHDSTKKFCSVRRVAKTRQAGGKTGFHKPANEKIHETKKKTHTRKYKYTHKTHAHSHTPIAKHTRTETTLHQTFYISSFFRQPFQHFENKSTVFFIPFLFLSHGSFS